MNKYMATKKKDTESQSVMGDMASRGSDSVEVTASVVQTDEVSKCHIHDNVLFGEIDFVHKEVCINDEPLNEYEGKNYCLFHLPNTKKNIDKFEEKFKEKLRAVEEGIHEIEKLPEEMQFLPKRRLRYSFDYVWFPAKLILPNFEFLAEIEFHSATFVDGVDFTNTTFVFPSFISATFFGDACFSEAKFTSDAYFSKSNFDHLADFRNTTFLGKAKFTDVEFGYAKFANSTFSDEADFVKAIFHLSNFDSAIFSSRAEFEGATFLWEALFLTATFSTVNFGGATFKGKVGFSNATFSSDAFFNYLTFPNGADFSEATFSGQVFFSGSQFILGAIFNKVKFVKDVFFDNSTFVVADFKRALFYAKANFSSASFSRSALFNETTFSSFTIFHSANFVKEANFASAIFSNEAIFISATFAEGANFGFASFSGKANFNLTNFSSAYFDSSIFSSIADFHQARFTGNACFDSVIFSDISDFLNATFDGNAFFRKSVHSKQSIFSDVVFQLGAYFSDAKVEQSSQLFFQRTKFLHHVDFHYASVEGSVIFEGKKDNRLFVGDQALLDLQNVQIEDARKISFHSVRLVPSWFINFTATELVFTDCQWRNSDGKHIKLITELQNLKNRGIENSNALLTKACWQLADNQEESKDFRQSSLFRQFANESKRLETSWYQQPFTLHWWYWLSSFYGESWYRALFNLILIVFVIFPITYTQTDFKVSSKNISVAVVEKADCIDVVIEKLKPDCKIETRGLNLLDGEAISHSLATAILQTIEYRKPQTVWGELWIILEKIFAPLQAALLALAIRRKFMR